MHVLVTGGAGFVGSALVRLLLREHDDVRVTTLDALTYAGDRARLAAVADDPRHHFVHGDVRVPDDVDEALRDVTHVAHLAAESHVDRSLDAPRVFLETNVLGTGVVLDRARAAGVARLLHVSTDEVYGPVAAPLRVDEDAPFRPTSPYAASKAGGDLLALSAAASHDVPVVVLRPANTLGPWQHPEKVVPLFTTNLLVGQDLPVYGPGTAVRDWLHVDDHAAAAVTALLHGEVGRAYNAGAGEFRTTLELADAICRVVGVEGDRVRHVPDRPAHDARYAVDDARLRALGWRPQHGFEEALADTVGWLRDHEDWWGPLREAGATRRRGLGGGAA